MRAAQWTQNNSHHHEEVEGAPNDVKAGVLEAEQVQVLAAQLQRLLGRWVHCCAAELPAATCHRPIVCFYFISGQLPCNQGRTFNTIPMTHICG